VSIFRAAVYVEKKGEAPFPPTERWESGRFLPVKSLLPLLKPSAAEVRDTSYPSVLFCSLHCFLVN
jgi:hypothetical protein